MLKRRLIFFLVIIFVNLCVAGVFGQTGPTPTPTPKLSSILAENLKQTANVSRERRGQGYAKLLEAQRYLWGMGRIRSAAGVAAGAKMARISLLQALDADPTLAEAYTALAEITLSSPPNDVDEAILLAEMAVKVSAENYGAHRILARVYTIKSRLNVGTLDPDFTEKAVAEWKTLARLDPRSAEAWAFLSNFYDRLGKTEDRIAALKKWMAAASPLETRFYRSVLGADQNLAPDSAGIKLGAALLKADRSKEAIEVLSQAVAGDPDNDDAIDLLRQAIEVSEDESTPQTLGLLRQAVYANPGSIPLAELLAEVQGRLGQTDEAVKTIVETIGNFSQGDQRAVARLQTSLGDIYFQAGRNLDAVAAYEAALKAVGIDNEALAGDDDRDFAVRVFEKIINTYKTAGRVDKARATIERARTVLGKNDLFSDKQIISLLRESRQNQAALQAVRAARQDAGDDYSLLRLEASVLTDMGRADEGVALIKRLIDNKPAVPSPLYDDFSNYIFISGLYNQAKMAKESLEAARRAFTVAQSEERRQIANLSLANAQRQSGDFKSAEATIRAILKKTPGNPIALNNLGYFLLERDDRVSEAVDLIKEAVKVDPTNPSYLDSLGWGYLKLGNFTESEKYLKEAVRYNPSSPTIHEHLGDLYEKQGKGPLAKASWQRALSFSVDAVAATRIREKMSNKP